MKKMKKMNRMFSAILAAGSLVIGSALPANAQEQVPEVSATEEAVLQEAATDEETGAQNTYVNEEEALQEAYRQIMDYAQKNRIPLDLSYETFAEEYQAGQYADLDEYQNVYLGLLAPQSRLKGTKGDGWYYNTGTSLPQKANYSKYNLLGTVKKGDLIFEANGGYGITAHIAIVEGIFYDSAQGQNYIRVVEAADQGVVRSVLDDQRVDDRAVSIYRVSGATDAVNTIAVDFCVGQVGKGYSLDFAKDTSSSEPDWYCSELLWAAFYNQGINIETSNFFNEPGVTPRDIINSSIVYGVSFS